MAYSAFMNRRKFLLGAAAAQLAASLSPDSATAAQSGAAQASAPTAPPARARQKIRQGVMSTVWYGSKLSFEERCETLARIGFLGVDLPGEAQIPTLKKYGLSPTFMTASGTGFKDG